MSWRVTFHVHTHTFSNQNFLLEYLVLDSRVAAEALGQPQLSSITCRECPQRGRGKKEEMHWFQLSLSFSIDLIS